MTRSSRRAGAAALITACTLALTACGDGQYVGSGVWTEKPEAVNPEGQAPGTPQQPTPPPPSTDPNNPAADPYVRATGLDQPWAILGMPDGTALVGERVSGNITRVYSQAGAPQELLYQVPGIDGSGTGGLLGLALPPNYFETGLIYAYITTATDNRVVSINAEGTAVPIITGIPKGTYRNGGAITVGGDGTIIVATGDTGDSSQVGNMNSLAGKILMINQFGDPALGESPIVRVGFGDPTGLCVNQGLLLVVDAGTGSPGAVTGNALYSVTDSDGLTGQKPLVTYTGETAGAAGCVAGGASVIATGLDSNSLMTTVLDGNGAPTGEPQLTLTGKYGRLRAIGLDPAASAIWVATSNRDGYGQPAGDDDKVLYLPQPSVSGGNAS